MIALKKPEEIKVIREGGKKLAAILAELVTHAKPGVATIEIDRMAEKMIREIGGEPSFKGYRGNASEPPFPTTICASVNNQLVHTPASNYRLKDGDIFTIDIGMRYPAITGFFTDMAVTIPIGKVSAEAEKLIAVTKHSLELGIAQAKAGNFVENISRAVQEYVEAEGFTIVRQFVGHGVGYAVHEDPRVPNYIGPKQQKVKLEPGLVIAIEPMVNAGGPEVEILDDGWTVGTADGGLCVHFEHTIAITKNSPEILTAL